MWAERSGEFSPEYYAYYGPNETSERIREVLEATVGRGASVLELGCSAGRHLAHLHESGYADLHGIDINEDAFDVLRETYPALAEAGTFHLGAIEDLLADTPDGRYDAVFSVETLQHVHPDAQTTFDDVARVTADTLVTVENEGPGEGSPDDPGVNYVNDEFPLFYRDWGRVFGERGFEEERTERLDRDTLRVFRKRGAEAE